MIAFCKDPHRVVLMAGKYTWLGMLLISMLEILANIPLKNATSRTKRRRKTRGKAKARLDPRKKKLLIQN